ncbi:SLAP domain-containing protein [Virgibacillus alimentarius]|uniref:SLAP domain-containing protein n=1 Tax=Virgibacillus alimentarius TaxID=698769 RepID=UPI00068AA4FB|nr:MULTISPECIES: SLAP domain-containing protein [Virgibacillus]HLR66720.1 SLAP domain-containing protein [Virgibacillus sp.]
MQKLTFHPAWEKTLSVKDKEQIEQSFHHTRFSSCSIHFTPLWEAINHKGELLVTVIIHNSTDGPVLFHHQQFIYEKNRTVIASSNFSLPSQVQKETSMPWTFIFPSGTFTDASEIKGGEITMKE